MLIKTKDKGFFNDQSRYKSLNIKFLPKCKKRTEVCIYNERNGHFGYLYVGAALHGKKEQAKTTNTRHLVFLTLEPANIVFSSFVPFPMPTTAKTEREVLLQN